MTKKVSNAPLGIEKQCPLSTMFALLPVDYCFCLMIFSFSVAIGTLFPMLLPALLLLLPLLLLAAPQCC